MNEAPRFKVLQLQFFSFHF